MNSTASDQLFGTIRIIVNPYRFLIFSTGAIVFLLLMSLLAIAIGGTDKVTTPVQLSQPGSILVQAFFLDRETSIPTLFNYALLVTACGLVFCVARVAFLLENSWRYHWLALSIIFLLLSFDEAAQIHEKLSGPMRQLFSASGAFHFAWIIPGLIFVAVFAVVFLNFLRALPVRIAGLMVLGGALYVTGAIGMEMIGGSASSSGLRNDWAYVFAVTFEEGLEMLGIAVFCTAILQLLSEGSNAENGYFTRTGDRGDQRPEDPLIRD